MDAFSTNVDWGSPTSNGTGSLGVLSSGRRVGTSGNQRESRFRLWSTPRQGRYWNESSGCADIAGQQFSITNVVGAGRRKDWLEGAPWEAGAIEHCRRHFNHVVLSASRELSWLLETSLLAHSQGKLARTGAWTILVDLHMASNWVLVIASFHPSFIRRGASALIGVLAHDLKRAVELARTGFTTHPVAYQERPSIDEARSFFHRCQESPQTLVTYDIETPTSRDLPEDERESDPSYEIESIQFSLAPYTGIFMPWTGDYIEIARQILALPNPKAGHGNWEYDDPRLRAQGVTIEWEERQC